MTSFAGQAIVVTGAASGIGRALSVLLGERGANLVLVDLDEGGLVELCEAMPDPARTAVVVGDVSDPVTAEHAFAVATERFGDVTGLASNAGVRGGVGSMTDVSVDEFDRLMRINARSAFIFVSAFATLARSAGRGGSIVLTSSAAGVKGSAGLVAYSMSKQALVGLARSAAVELAGLDVRVNAVTPGRIDTPLLDGFVADKEAGLSVRPIARAADPVEVAYLIAWLLSDESAFATGGIYPIDGGLSA